MHLNTRLRLLFCERDPFSWLDGSPIAVDLTRCWPTFFVGRCGSCPPGKCAIMLELDFSPKSPSAATAAAFSERGSPASAAIPDTEENDHACRSPTCPVDTLVLNAHSRLGEGRSGREAARPGLGTAIAAWPCGGPTAGVGVGRPPPAVFVRLWRHVFARSSSPRGKCRSPMAPPADGSERHTSRIPTRDGASGRLRGRAVCRLSRRGVGAALPQRRQGRHADHRGRSARWTSALPCRPAAPVVFHHSKGARAQPTDFLPIDEPVAANADIRLAPNGGRSSDGVLPFFNLQWPGGGLVGGGRLVGPMGDAASPRAPGAADAPGRPADDPPEAAPRREHSHAAHPAGAVAGRRPAARATTCSGGC